MKRDRTVASGSTVGEGGRYVGIPLRCPEDRVRYIVNENDTAEAMTKLLAHVQAQPVNSNVVPLKKAAEGRA